MTHKAEQPKNQSKSQKTTNTNTQITFPILKNQNFDLAQPTSTKTQIQTKPRIQKQLRNNPTDPQQPNNN